MSQLVIKGTEKLSETIKSRRIELGLTIEEAASRAGVGMKTWCRYEAGESIRKDKAKGVCKALNWHMFPEESKVEGSDFDIAEYRSHEVWSKYIEERYGEAAAISFVVGSDILLDYVEADLNELAELPRGSHIGQLSISMLKDILPRQFLMRYDYEFLYCLRWNILRVRAKARYNNDIIAQSVIDELVLYLIVETAEFLMETMIMNSNEYEIQDTDGWQDWIYDLFDDMDIVTWLYGDNALTSDHVYHFDHWMEQQFFV